MNVHDDDFSGHDADFERYLAGDGAAGSVFASFDDLDDPSPVRPSAELASVLRDGLGTSTCSAVVGISTRRVRASVWRAGVGVAAVSLAFGGVAAAGSLPDPLQSFAAKVAGAVGISIPRPPDDGPRILPSDTVVLPADTAVSPSDDDEQQIDPVTATTVENETDVDDDPVTTVEVDSDVDDDPVATLETDDGVDDDPAATIETDDGVDDDPATTPEIETETDDETDDDPIVQSEDDTEDDDSIIGLPEDALGADDSADA